MLPENNLPEVRVSQEFLNIIDRTGIGKTIDEKVKLSLAIGLFVEKAVSLARAAELAGKPLAIFIEILQTKRIPWMEYTEDHFADDLAAIQKYTEKKNG
jgi:predicted HTH domain antitoxin